MTFLAPLWLVVAVGAAAWVTVLHLFTRSQPGERVLPTARFVPEATLHTLSRSARLADLGLLILRVLILLLIGVALARPVLEPRRAAHAVIALVDDSPGADSTAVAKALGDLTPRADTVIRSASLSAGLVTARRAGVSLASRADSLELVVISSFTAGLWDAATPAIRDQWPGGVRLVPVVPAGTKRVAVEIDAGADDVLRAALDRLGRTVFRGTVLIRRRGISSADSARVAREGGVLVAWPPAPGRSGDSVSAVFADGIAVVGPLTRTLMPPPGLPAAWFADGAVAATEQRLGKGCERDVGFSMEAGDGLLRSAGLRLIEYLLAPCGTAWTPEKLVRLDSSRLARLAGTGGRVAAAALRSHRPHPPAVLALLLAGLAIMVERLVRRKRSEGEEPR